MTAKTPGHTPTPWRRYADETIHGADGKYVCATSAVNRSASENEANTDLIFRAVNAHETLIAAVEMALEDYPKWAWADEARAAVRLARGEP